ncbi:peptidoglycan-binding protein [Cellulomonas sp. P22]|uniref:peptidoglycan-binding protein n=1 Tax=Cellulomonas sp. P22 TaxID=3373189 RepID=UPI0037BC7D7C
MRWLALTVVVALAVAGGWWAGRQTATAPPDAAQEQATVLATVTQVSVGRTTTYNATVTQPFDLVASNVLSGVVTSVGALDDVQVGDELYAVGADVVRAVVGDVPFWRDLAEGTTGADVLQLEQALSVLGHLGATPDEKFGPGTTRAVRAWQKATGQEQTGTVRLGLLVALPSLPATVVLDEAIRRGLQLTGGEPAVTARVRDPEFTLVLTSDQANLIPPAAQLDVLLDGMTWPAVITGVAPGTSNDGQVVLLLAAPDGSLVCGAQCGLLPRQETTYLTAQVHVVPQVDGPGVPAAAVHTDASGGAYVLGPDGQQRPVTVRGSGDGMAVVDGLALGDQVVVVGTDPVGAAAAATGTVGDS